MILLAICIILVLLLLLLFLSTRSSIPTEADIVIVGGGTAGFVVARRLSERFPHKKILVLERGENNTNNPIIYNPKNGPYAAYHAPFSQVLTTNFPNVQISLASTYGGGSSHNYSLAVKGSPDFYNNKWGPVLGLSYDQLQPYFAKVDSMMQITPLPTSIDVKSKILPVLTQGPGTAIKAASIFLNKGALRAGDAFSDVVVQSIASTKNIPIVDNYNGHFEVCVSKTPQVFISGSTGIRQETFNTYLPADYRAKAKNLVIVPNATVTRVESDGVIWKNKNGQEVKMKAKKIIMAAGAIYTPFLLLKSGYSKVGQDLINHYGTTIVCSVEGVDEFSSASLAFVPYLSESSRDWQLVITGGVDDRLVGGQQTTGTRFSMLLWLLNPRSRGSITSEGPIPTVNLNMFTDGGLDDPESDLSSTLSGLRWMYTVVQEIRKAYPSITILYPPEEAMIQDNSDVLMGYVKNGVSVTDHYSVSCPLGTAVDPTTFNLIENPKISVVDASTFPNISNGNTTYPVLIMAEIATARIAQNLT